MNVLIITPFENFSRLSFETVKNWALVLQGLIQNGIF